MTILGLSSVGSAAAHVVHHVSLRSPNSGWERSIGDGSYALAKISWRKTSPVVMIAQQISASLLASATATRRSGFLAQQRRDPGGESAVAFAGDAQRRGAPDHQHLSHVSVALLGDGAELLLAAARVLPRRQPKPRREVASRLEHARVRDAGGDRRGDQRADAGNEIERAGSSGFRRWPSAIFFSSIFD